LALSRKLRRARAAAERIKSGLEKSPMAPERCFRWNAKAFKPNDDGIR
jgi:hypothetical protein